MPSSSAALGLLPPSALERLVDDLHLDLAQRLRREPMVLDLRRLANAAGALELARADRAARSVRDSQRIAACSITLASSRTLPGQLCQFQSVAALRARTFVDLALDAADETGRSGAGQRAECRRSVRAAAAAEFRTC